MAEIRPLLSPTEIMQALKDKIRPGVPSFFELRAQLPSVGRSDLPIAASERLTVVLKTYAEGGENALHAHPNEDHVFVVLQGQASFYGPKDELKIVGAYGGVMLPHGSFYRFESTGDCPLVMLRVGCATPGSDFFARIRLDGEPLAADSTENRQVTPVLSTDWFPAQTAAAA